MGITSAARRYAPRGGSYLASENPYNGEAWAELARGNAEDVNAAVSAAKAAFENPAWSGLTASKRGALLRKVADLIAEEAPRLAQIEQRDNGKLAAEVNSQVRYVSEYFHYYAGLADKVQGHVVPNDKGGALTYIRYEPKGVVGDHHAVEFAADIDELETGARARGRLHGRHQTLRVHLMRHCRVC